MRIKTMVLIMGVSHEIHLNSLVFHFCVRVVVRKVCVYIWCVIHTTQSTHRVFFKLLGLIGIVCVRVCVHVCMCVSIESITLLWIVII